MRRLLGAITLTALIPTGATILTLGTDIPVIQTATAQSQATGHLDWDTTDEVWRCVGSPSNCDFQQE